MFLREEGRRLLACVPHRFTLSLLKEPVILFLRELNFLLTLVPFSTFSARSSSSSFLLKQARKQKYFESFRSAECLS